MADETIIYEKKDGVATLTFNRPQAMNAGNFQMMEESRRAIEDARDDDAVRVLIVTGAGRAFHAGDDVKEVFLGDDREKRRTAGKVARIRGTTGPSGLPQIFKPTIAAVNGAAVGYGMDIALSCDIRIASENAKFGYFYVRRGLMGTEIGPLMLVHNVGLSRAMEMMLSGELIDAAEADRIGLVSRIVPAEKLLEEANTLAVKLMQAAPLAQQAVKRSVYKALYDPSEIAQFTGNLLSLLFETEDHLEGARAFVEKREPEYKGR